MSRMRSSTPFSLLACSLLAFALAGCGAVVTPILDVRATADDSRPAAGSDNCASAEQLSGVVTDQIVYVVHALPEPMQHPPGELEITIATGCTELSLTHAHADGGVALVPVALPEGAECGVVITTTVANATDQCVLTGADEGSAPCSFECSNDTDTGSEDETTDTTG